MYTKGKSMIFIVRTIKVLNYLRVALKAEKKNKMITLSKHCQFFYKRSYAYLSKYKGHSKSMETPCLARW